MLFRSSEEYHHPDGYGRVTHNGRSYRYQDYPVAKKIKGVDGRMMYPTEHDARNVDFSEKEFKTPEGKKVGHIVAAFATASTKKSKLKQSGFFHRVEDIDAKGIYHDGHPAQMEAAGFKPHIGKI